MSHVVSMSQVLAVPAERLFDAPSSAIPCDEVLLVSTRDIGTVCDRESMRRKLRCQRLVTGSTGALEWKTADWRRLLSQPEARQTIIYVHGNRVAAGKDRTQGMEVYRSLKAHCGMSGPVRFIIWSWPSAPIPRPVKDYRVKAERTNPVAWQLAWLLDKMPMEAQISLVGYSYGTRVVSGAAHLLGGGQLGALRLDERLHPQRPRVRAALLAAAFDADWIQPGQFYGRSLNLFGRLVLSTNELDPAMRFYHLSNGLGRTHALGKSGVHEPGTLETATRRLRCVDYTSEVGRRHSLAEYLAAEDKMSKLWYELTIPDDPAISRSTVLLSRKH